jgi:hypothetical protein
VIFFKKWGLTSLKVKTPVLEMNWVLADADKDAAWDLYVELLTRISTQRLPGDHGIESTALESIYSLFPITRTTLKQLGRKAIGFSRIAIIILNQIVRPFTSKWHRLSGQVAFSDATQCSVFRSELYVLQEQLRNIHGFLLILQLLRTLPKWMLMPANIKIQKTRPWMASHLGTPARF